ncbi:hypothetical protein SAMN05216382_2632 [Sphingomonas palmae]|uniref:DUF4349 domain-containing protein n=1 Tax=Sphingomonas palmae TaxID=1855283 RepID=A0A1H7T106_9SPHN|nr:hypothetical protein [Sphingomonas palmae]SEL78398.1 hypothetical protein SAMN05216382_2632 [Sphingomonas palmae]
MRWLVMGVTACIVMTGCSKAPDNDGPGEAATRAKGVAFAYRYDFRLPSARIADAQEAQAQACEQLAPARCRITGMTYRLDGAGSVAASLDVAVSAPDARAFGRRSVKAIEAFGGALTGAEITGTDPADALRSDPGAMITAMGENLTSDAAAPTAAQPDRAAKAAAAAERERVATTPIRFDYAAGSGVGLTARLAEAAQAGYASLTWTLASLLTLLAWAGPPLAVVLLLGWLWHRFGRGWWKRAFPPRIV